ncbi:alpha/beta fold hydrolase [Sporobolomyces koalae]|uniref:alpha/beta fold hydrolase n=1 Tax=Sporobolomyces koalae TaxID=500713 RepID=UPI00317D0314
MPFHHIQGRDIELFHVLNPDPRDLVFATEPSQLPSRPFKPDLPTLVLVHASASDVLHWNRQFSDERLMEHFNLFGIDCINNGWTRGPEKADGLRLEDSADFLVSVLDAMNFPSYHLLGEAVHGCNLATWIAVKRADKVKSLTLASPGFREEPPDVYDALVQVRDALLANKVGQGGDDTGEFPEEPLSDIVAYFIGGLDRLADARAEMRARFQARYGTGRPLNDVLWLFNAAVMERRKIPDELLAAVTMPVLLLRGSEDNIVSPERACEEWRRAFSGAAVTSQTIASAPSLLSLSDANIVDRIVAPFCLRAL